MNFSTKEANTISFSQNNGFALQFKKKVKKLNRKGDFEERTAREEIKHYQNNKPKRSFSGGGFPKNRVNRGNSNKIINIWGFETVNNFISKRKAKKADIEHSIKTAPITE